MKNLLSPFLLVLCISGPIHWNEFFPIADGDQQSPIEIKTKEVKYDSSLRPLSIKYDPTSAKIISNSGHSFNVDFDDSEDKSGWLFLFICCGKTLDSSIYSPMFHSRIFKIEAYFSM